MSRAQTIQAIFAAAAQTTIPGSPSSGIPYRDTALGPATIEQGWPFNTPVESANFNQILWELFTVAKDMEIGGLPTWSPETDYRVGSMQTADDGIAYVAVTQTGPNEGGAIDPTTPAQTDWAPLAESLLLELGIDEDMIDAITNAAAPTAANPFLTVAELGSVLSISNLLHVEEQQASGVNAGNSIGSTWNVRDLNVEVTNNIAGSALAISQVTLPAGTYWVEISAPVYSDGTTMGNQVRFRNVTDASSHAIGQSALIEGSLVGDDIRTFAISRGFGKFTIASAKTFELQHFTQGGETNGLGRASTSGEVEVYAQARIWKVGV